MGIVAFERLVYNIRLTHALMTQHVPSLDPFDKLYAQANEIVSMVSFHGRVVLHIVYELIADLSGYCAYNSITQRFVRTAASVALREVSPLPSFFLHVFSVSPPPSLLLTLFLIARGAREHAEG